MSSDPTHETLTPTGASKRFVCFTLPNFKREYAVYAGGSDVTRIQQLVAKYDEATFKILGRIDDHSSLSCSFNSCLTGRKLYVVSNTEPFLESLTARTAFAASIESALGVVAEYTVHLSKLGALIPLISRYGIRRPLTMLANNTFNFPESTEITEGEYAAHRVGCIILPVSSLWKPLINAPVKGGKIDMMLLALAKASYGRLNFCLDDVDGRTFREDFEDDSVFAQLQPTCGFECLAGIDHPSGTTVTVEERDGLLLFTCNGPERYTFLGFGDSCCKKSYRRGNDSISEVEASAMRPLYIDSNGIERAPAMSLELFNRVATNNGFESPRVVALRERKGSGKTRIAISIAREFLNAGGRIVYSGSTKSLVKIIQPTLEAALGVEFMHYTDDKTDDLSVLSNSNIVTCTQSLAKCITTRSTKKTLIILDEPVTSLAMIFALNGLDALLGLISAVDNYKDLKILALDAQFNINSTLFFRLAAREIVILENPACPYRNFMASLTYHVTRDKNEVVVQKYGAILAVLEHLSKGRSVLVSCSTKVMAVVMGQAITGEMGSKVKVYVLTGDVSEESRTGSLDFITGSVGIDKSDGVPTVVLHTQVVSVGLSAGVGVFQAVIVCVNEYGPSANAVAQSLARRRPENGEESLVIEIFVGCRTLSFGGLAPYIEDYTFQLQSLTLEEQACLASYEAIQNHNGTKTTKKDIPKRLLETDFYCRVENREEQFGSVFHIDDDGVDRMVTRFVRREFEPLFSHEDAKRELTSYKRFLTAARADEGERKFYQIEALAMKTTTSITSIENPDLDLLITHHLIEKETRAEFYISDLTRILEWELMKPVTRHVVELNKNLDADRQKVALLKRCRELAAALPMLKASSLSRHILRSFQLSSDTPLYKTAEEREKAMIKVAASSKSPVKNGVTNIQAYQRTGEESEEDENTDEILDHIVWNDQTMLRVYKNLTLCIGEEIVTSLCKRVIACEDYVAGLKAREQKFTKFPASLLIDGVNPITIFTRLYSNDAESNVIRAYTRLLDGKEKWNNTTIKALQLKKLITSAWPTMLVMHKVVQTLKEVGVDITSGEKKQFASSEMRRPGLLSAINADRAPSKCLKSSSRPRAIIQALRSLVKPVGISILWNEILSEYEVKLHPLMIAFMNNSFESDAWRSASTNWDRFWKVVYSNSNEVVALPSETADVNDKKRKRDDFYKCTNDVIKNLGALESDKLAYECDEMLNLECSLDNLDKGDFDELVQNVPDFNFHRLQRQNSRRCLTVLRQVAVFCTERYDDA